MSLRRLRLFIKVDFRRRAAAFGGSIAIAMLPKGS
jgi:hypothetical protein